MPYGTGETDAAAPPPGIGGETAIPLGWNVVSPQLIERVEPEYPEMERKARKEGIVILSAIITVDGLVDEVRVLKSADPILDESARRAVIRWRYKPASLNGRAVRVYLTVTVRFSLH